MKYDLICAVPVYKVAKYLPDLLDSILKLDTSGINFFFHFVEDCSPTINPFGFAEEWEIIRNWIQANSFPGMITKHAVNKGLAASRNTGLTHPVFHAKYLTWIDSDDAFACPDSLKRRINFMEQNPDIGFAYGSYLTFKGDLQQAIRDNKLGDPMLQEFDYGKLIQANQFACWAGIIRSELFEGFTEEFRICEDYDFNLRHALKMKFKLIDPKFYTTYYRLRDNPQDPSLSFDPAEQKFHHQNNMKMKRNAVALIRKNGVSSEVAQFNRIHIPGVI